MHGWIAVSGLRRYLESSSFFEVLTRLLSRVKVVKHLEIILDVDKDLAIWPCYRPSQKDLDECVQQELIPSEEIIRSGPNWFHYSLEKNWVMSKPSPSRFGIMRSITGEGGVHHHPPRLPPFNPPHPPKYREAGEEKSGKVIEEL